MDHKTPKPRLKNPQNAAIRRPSNQKTKNEKNPHSSLKDKFNLQILQQNPWGQFLLFVEDYYRKYISAITEEDRKISQILQKSIITLNKYYQDSWKELLNKIPESDYQKAENFYYSISRRYKLTPQEVYQESQAAIKGLINNAEYGFIDSDNRDLGRITQLNYNIDYFYNHSYKTYLILVQLETYLPENAQPLFAASTVFQSIIRDGVNDSLADFGMALMKHFRITRADIKDETNKNLAISVGETERELTTQIGNLEAEKLELVRELEQIRQQGHQETVTEIAQALQNGSQPALDQIQKIISLLQPQIEATGEAEISSDDALAIFIVLRNLMTILQKLGIENYPKSLTESFTISQIDLAKYAYVEGTPFTEETEIKQVKCIQKGWKVNDQIITPAQVKELTANSANN